MTQPETVPRHQHVTKPGIMMKYERCQGKIHLSHLQLCSWTAVNWSNQTHRTQVVSKLPLIWTQPHLNASRLAFSIRPAQTSSGKLSDVTPTYWRIFLVVVGVYRAEQVLKFISFTFQKIVTYRKFSGNYEINHDRKKLDPEQIKKEWRRPRAANLSLFSRSLTVWIWVWGLSGWQQTVFFSPGFLLCQSWSWKYICWQNREFRKCDLFHSLFSSWEKASLCIFVVVFVMMNLKHCSDKHKNNPTFSFTVVCFIEANKLSWQNTSEGTPGWRKPQRGNQYSWRSTSWTWRPSHPWTWRFFPSRPFDPPPPWTLLSSAGRLLWEHTTQSSAWSGHFLF